jgi:hypothetical protein
MDNYKKQFVICGLDFPEENFRKHILKRKKEGLIKTKRNILKK